MTSSEVWDRETAERYDDPEDPMNQAAAIEPAVDFLYDLAGSRPALELAIGTGRIGVPLRERGVAVSGIELSGPMLDVLRRKVEEARLPVVIGDMASATAPGAGEFALVYLVYNTIGNLRTQEEQVACVANAARHLAPGGRFVVEVGVPPLRRLPPGQIAAPFDLTETHLGIDTFDLVTQQATSHHYTREPDGRYRAHRHHFRYVWPSELDLMARLAGLSPEARYASWERAPFTAESTRHVSVWHKPV